MQPLNALSAQGPVPSSRLHRRGEWRRDRCDRVPQRWHPAQIHRPLLHPSGLGSGRHGLRRTAQHGDIPHHFLARYVRNHMFKLLSFVCVVSSRESTHFYRINSSGRSSRLFLPLTFTRVWWHQVPRVWHLTCCVFIFYCFFFSLYFNN